MSVAPAGASSAQAPLFRLRDVVRTWKGVEALRGISLDIMQGEMVLLAGPSGSGKSTLLRILTGALNVTSGTAEVRGSDLSKMSARDLRDYKRSCGIVEQGNLLVPQLDVHRNVIAGFLPYWPWYRVLLSSVWPIERERVSALLGQLGISERQWEVTANLSGGQQQRVAVARGLIAAPSVIIADEPTASLDEVNAIHVTKMLVECARQSNATLILCTHSVNLSLPYMTRFIGLRDGTVAMDVKASAVTEDALVDEDSMTALYRGSLEL